MKGHDLRGVHAYVIDRDSQIRRLLRGIISRMGIDRISEFATPTDAAESLAGAMPDLLFVEGDPPDGEGFRFIHQLRHSGSAANPFVPVVALTWEPNHALMVRFTGSGADDLMVKPFSTKQVQDRVVKMIEARKPFVVTSDYLGPDRRRSPREGQQIPQFDVPNTLRDKALGTLDRATIGDRLAASIEVLNAQKVVRHGFQAAFLMDFAYPGLIQEPPPRWAIEHLLRSQAVVEDLLRRMTAGDGRVVAENYARVMLNAVEGFRHALAHPMADADVCRRAALGLAALTAARTDLDVLESEIAVAVAGYRNRLEQLAREKAGISDPPADGR